MVLKIGFLEFAFVLFLVGFRVQVASVELRICFWISRHDFSLFVVDSIIFILVHFSIFP